MRYSLAARPFSVMVLLWAVAGCGLAYGWTWLDERLWVLAPALPAAWALAGLGLFGGGAWRGRWQRPVAVALVAAGVLTVAGPLGAWGEAHLLRYRLAVFSAALEGIRQTHAPGSPATGWRQHEDGISYRVDPGPPVRVAFLLPGSLIDNWTGIVFDPSGEVMRANAFAADWSNWDDPDLAPVKTLFGGDLRRCRPLEPRFYLCGFT